MKPLNKSTMEDNRFEAVANRVSKAEKKALKMDLMMSKNEETRFSKEETTDDMMLASWGCFR
ncbi:MAG: hypothetical protein Q9183_006213, partial [Haloplaca sp. 2 TL-2023]